VASGGPNEGTIRERADGRWEARAFVTKPDGRRVRRSLLLRTRSHSSRLLVVPITQGLAQGPRDPARDRLLDGGQDVGWETRGLCDRALHVDPVARRELLGRDREEAREVGKDRAGRPSLHCL